jgi:hypothetical protein
MENNIEFDLEAVEIIENLSIQIYKLFSKGYTKEQLQELWLQIVDTTDKNFNALNAEIKAKGG